MIVTVRLFSYKSFRHYGGRQITTTPHIGKAIAVKFQSDHTVVVELLEDCAGYKKGYTIAVQESNFNL